MHPQSTTIPPLVDRQCATCGNPFVAKRDEVLSGNGRYCSIACYRLGRRSRVTLRCAQCGQEFTVKASQGDHQFCAMSCRRAHQRANLRPLADRFWEKVQKTEGCWLWIGSLRGGYGQFFIDTAPDGKPIGAHRVSWELHHGTIPDGLQVLHNCPDGDNPACVNPAHLFLGTQLDNMRDMYRKGRENREARARGEQGSGAKLTEATVLSIRARYAAGATARVLADEHGVSIRTIRRIVARRTWGHI